ncbi:MAG: hypothetical protein ACRBM6_30395 [Geminicoccales bacterium]
MRQSEDSLTRAIHRIDESVFSSEDWPGALEHLGHCLDDSAPAFGIQTATGAGRAEVFEAVDFDPYYLDIFQPTMENLISIH